MLSLLTALTVSLSGNALDLAVTGTGTTQAHGDNSTAFGTEIRLEKFVNDKYSVGYVQGVSLDSTDLRGTSELFVAYNLNYKVFGLKNQVYVGGGAKVGYGDQNFEASAGPVLGNRLFLKDDVYVLTQVNYDVGLNQTSDNVIRYSIGLGVRF